MPNFLIAQLDELSAQPCPCGSTRRAFAEIPRRKRKLYACRYHLLDDWERKLAVTVTGTTIQDRVR